MNATNAHPEPAEPPTATAPPTAPPALHIANLRFAYPHGALQIHVPHLTLAPGEQMLLTGGSGCGKSTLLNLIAGLLTAHTGTIAIAGTDIQSLRPAARDRLRAGRIGMVFQTFNLLPGFSSLENVMLGLTFGTVPLAEHQPRARALLDSLGLDPLTQQRATDQLSVGQQQRVAVARALITRPALVLADEPTASLDPDNARAAVAVLQNAAATTNTALLCVSHDPALLPLFPRHLSMSQLNADAPSAKEAR